MEVKQSRSVLVNKYGGYDSLSVDNFNLPELEGHIEVKVHYGGLNFADLYTRQGLSGDKKPPFVLGMECTGTITAILEANTDLKIGQKVICYDYKGGMYRDIVRVTPDKCYLLPDYIDCQIGAAIFVNYLTAYFTLIELGNLKEKDKILILSCAGGVGWAATQLAKLKEGVQVYGTASAGKEPEVKENGVDIFYSHQAFKTEAVKEKFDLIITNEAGTTFTHLQNMLNHLGRIILIGASDFIKQEKRSSFFVLFKTWWSMKDISQESLIMNNRVVGGLHLGTLIKSNPTVVREALNYIFDLYKKGSISPKIYAVMPMSNISKATKLLGDRVNIGKVLIHMEETETC